MKISRTSLSSPPIAPSLRTKLKRGSRGCASAAILVACSSEPTPSEFEQSQHALLTDFSFEDNCDNAEIAAITDGQIWGRKAARSSALLECVTEAATTGLPKHFTSVDFGPYAFCDHGDGPKDPLANASAQRQVARILNIAESRLPTKHNCPASGVNEEEGPGGWAFTSLTSSSEYVNWTSIGAPKDNAYLLWHEAAHTHGYMHNNTKVNDDKEIEYVDICGYDLGAPDQEADAANRRSAPNIYSKCMKEVIYQSDASAVCQAMACETNELAVVKRYGEFGGNDACECVPDVFADQNENGDRFGHAMAAGDFDDDGYEDLVVSAPGEGVDIGAIYVYRGSPYGLRFWKRTSQWFLSVTNYKAGSTFWPGQSVGDEFGRALAAGDINGDGFDDILVGAPGKLSGQGVVYILPGSSYGPDTQKAQWLDQAESGGAVENGDRFGSSITVGQFNSDQFMDFAIGAPEEVYAGSRSGVVSVHRGRSATAGSGTFEYNDGVLHQAMGVGQNETGDEFGYALAAGDTDGDGTDELVIGGPGENSDLGYFFLFERGSSWSGVASFTHSGLTRLGETIAVGDFIGDGKADVAVGAPKAAGGEGRVATWKGGNSLSFAQILSGNETDAFGRSIAIGQVGIEKGDLIVGMPGEEYGSGPAEGRIAVYSGVNGTQLGSPYRYLRQADFFDGGPNDELIPPEHKGVDALGHSLVLLRLPGTSTLGVVAGAPTDTVDQATSGAVFQFKPGLVADRKLDQVSMRLADALPY